MSNAQKSYEKSMEIISGIFRKTKENLLKQKVRKC